MSFDYPYLKCIVVLCPYILCFVFRSTMCMINKLKGCDDEDLKPMGMDADSIKQMEDSVDILGC